MEFTDGKKKSLMMWLVHTHKASNVEFGQDTYEFDLDGKHRTAYIEIIGLKSKGLLCSKNTFNNELIVQFTPSYISIVNVKKAKEMFEKNEQFITRVKGSGYWEVELPIAKKFINILFYDDE